MVWLRALVPGHRGETTLLFVTGSERDRTERVVVALGGNAIAADGNAGPEAQVRAVQTAAEQIVELLAAGYDVVVTHGNGPQVGNLLVKNDLARGVVPPVPLDWCVAQTQATLGFLLVTALEYELARRAIDRMVVAVVTRVSVNEDDPGWTAPSKPIGRYLPQTEAWARIERGEHWELSGPKGWRRVVPSPQPQAILDSRAIDHLVGAGAVVIAAGGGGIPMLSSGDQLHGVEAVLDKDRTAALLGESVNADVLVIATDVSGVAVGYGTDDERWLGQTTPAELNELAAEGHFGSGSMGPKVEAAGTVVRPEKALT
jgi:carbamate kinase